MDIGLGLIFPWWNGPHSSRYLPQHWFLLLCFKITVDLIKLVHFLAVLTLRLLNFDISLLRTDQSVFLPALDNLFYYEGIFKTINYVLFGWRLVVWFRYWCLISAMGRIDREFFLETRLTRVEPDSMRMILRWSLKQSMILTRVRLLRLTGVHFCRFLINWNRIT